MATFTLWDIADEAAALMRQLEELPDDASDGERDALIEACFSTEDLMGEKVGAYVHLIRSYETRQQALSDEAGRILKLATEASRNGGRLRDRLKSVMEAHGRKEIQYAAGVVKVQKNGGLPPLIIPDEWVASPTAAPEQFHRRRIELDKTAIREALKGGEVVDGCRIGEAGSRLVLK